MYIYDNVYLMILLGRIWLLVQSVIYLSFRFFVWFCYFIIYIVLLFYLTIKITKDYIWIWWYFVTFISIIVMIWEAHIYIVKKEKWSKVLRQMWEAKVVLVVGSDYFPMILCSSNRHKILSLFTKIIENRIDH